MRHTPGLETSPPLGFNLGTRGPRGPFFNALREALAGPVGRRAGWASVPIRPACGQGLTIPLSPGAGGGVVYGLIAPGPGSVTSGWPNGLIAPLVSFAIWAPP
jgi:hypothetical protein